MRDNRDFKSRMPSNRIEMELSGLDGIRSGISVTEKVWAIRSCFDRPDLSVRANVYTDRCQRYGIGPM